MGFRRAASLAVLALAVQSASPILAPELASVAYAAPADTYNPIKASAVRNASGKPVGMAAYDDWTKAIEAGDMAAVLGFIDAGVEDIPSSLEVTGKVVREIVAENLAAAHQIIEANRETEDESLLAYLDYLDAWVYAIEGDGDKAVSLHRSSDQALPGITADLSLAALLEAVGREDQALAVYRALTPGEITAPENLFDMQVIVFQQIEVVINRRTLLLRRMGRIDDAVAVFQRLAEAEPEQAVGYAAAIENLKNGKGLDDEPLKPVEGLSRALFDLSDAVYLAKLIEASRQGVRLKGFDHNKSALDQFALMLVADNEAYRTRVARELQREALFEGAAHVSLSGPEDTPDLLLYASQALLDQHDTKAAKRPLKRAVKLADEDPDEEFAILSNAVRLYMRLEDQRTALKLTDRILELADNPAQLASGNATAAMALTHFGRHDEALVHAREARRLDDTHDRRVALATVLGDVGEIEEAMRILQTERLKRPNDPYALNSLGYFQIEHTEDYANGFLALARAQSLATANPYIADSVGWALYKLGHVDEGMRFVKKSREELLPHTHWEVEDHYGDLLWLQGDKEGAREAWAAAAKQYPPLDIKAKIEAKLSGKAEPKRYEKQPIPNLRRDDEGEVASREI